MARPLYLEVRRHELLEQIRQTGQVTVTELSNHFGVSEVTIRNDLNNLAERNLIVRTHGGAVPATNVSDLSLVIRSQQHLIEKDRIGEMARPLIEDGEAIFLDTSSTALAIATLCC